MSEGPHLPAHVTAAKIEEFMDRIALEVAESKHGKAFLPLYEWLEGELDLRRKQQSTLDSVAARVKRFRDRTEEQS